MKTLRELSMIAVVMHGAGPRWDIPHILREELRAIEVNTIREDMYGGYSSAAMQEFGYRKIEIYPIFGDTGLEWHFLAVIPGVDETVAIVMPGEISEIRPALAGLFLLPSGLDLVLVYGYILDPDRQSVKVVGSYFDCSGETFFNTIFIFFKANGTRRLIIQSEDF